MSAPTDGFSLARERSDEDTHTDEENDTEGSIPYSEDFDDWPDAPVMVRPDPEASHQVMQGLVRRVLWGLAGNVFAGVKQEMSFGEMSCRVV